MKLSQRIMFAKIFATGLAFLSFAALADTLWPTADDKKNAYWEDVWGEVNDYYVFKDVSDATALFRTYISLPNNRAIWVDGSNVVFEGDDADCGLVCSGNAWNTSMTVGRNRGYGLLTIKKGQYYLSSALYVGAGISGGKLVLDGGTVTAADGVFLGSGDNGAIGEIVVNEGAVLNSTASSGDKFSICKGGNGHNDTKGYLTINGGTVNVASTLFTCQEGGTGDITINSGALNVEQNSYLARGYYNSSTSTLTMNGGTFWTGGNFELAAHENRNAGTATLNMNGGAIDVGGTIYWGGNKSGANVTVNMKGGSITATNHIEIAAGGGSTANVTMDGGSITSMTSDHLYIANASGSTGNVTINDGKLESTTKRIYVGKSGTGTLTVNGGEVTWGDQLIVACDASGTGTLNVNGGMVARSDHLLQVGLNGHGCFNMTGGETICSGFRLGTDSAQAVGIATISGGTLTCASDDLYVANGGTGTLNLNGGVVVTRRFYIGSGTGTLNLNGGVMKTNSDRGDFIWNDPSHLTVNICAGGAVFDTAGKSITVPATLNNAEGLVGNGTIAKKGLGTLTISSNLDLERTFKFTIDTDLGAAGVGTIALTGSNTLEAGDKITVEIDPVNAETNVAYAVMTGLGELTIADIVLTGTDFYSYTGEVTDGTLSVTLQYGPTAPITARYDNGAWGVYNANNELIPNGTATNLTTYVFNGSEPAGDFENYATTHKVALVAAGIGVTNTINISSNVNAHHLAVSTDEGCAVVLSGDFTLAADSLVNSGTLIFDGNVMLSGVVNYPFYIAEGARVTLVTPQTIGGEISGTGTLALTGGTFGYLKTGETTIMDAFAGTLVLCAGSQLDTQYNRRGNTDKFHIMLGTARVRMEGATLTVPNDNEAYIYNEVDIVSSTENVIQGGNNALCLNGRLIGGGTVTLRCPGNRGGRIQGDASDFTGTCIIENAFGANGGDEGFHGANAGSQNATWVLPADGICSEEYKKTYYVGAQDATIYFGAFQQTGAKAYVCIGTTGTSIQIGNLAGGESVIEGRFTNNPFTLSKVGADSWLTLGTNFNMVAGSTVNIAEGGLGFNLPEGETVTALTNATVSISPSVRARVSMTAAQYAALDTARTYTLAKLASSPGVSKLATVLSVDGEVPQGKNAAKWRVRFNFVDVTAQEDAHYEAVLEYSAPGFVIIIQ